MRLPSPDIETIVNENSSLQDIHNFIRPFSIMFENHFKREGKYYLRFWYLKSNERKQKARMLIAKYIENRINWMTRNFLVFFSNIALEVSKTLETHLLLRKRYAFYFFYLFLDKWRLDDVTADIKRICQLARLPSASFDKIPIAFKAEIKPYYPQIENDDGVAFFNERKSTMSRSIKEVINRVDTEVELIRLKTDELKLSVEIPNVSSAKMRLMSLDSISNIINFSDWREVQNQYQEGFRKMNEIGSITISSALTKFDKAVQTKIREIKV